MTEILFYINNSEVKPPRNWKELAIELNYGKDQFPQGNTVSLTNFEWVRENYDWIKSYIDQGLTGGVGIFEAPPFRIDIKNGNVTKTVFNGYIDLTDSLQLKERIGLTSKAASHATVDWINQVANSFTFEYLASLPTGAPGKIDSSMYKFMPYVNNQVPNYEQAAIATLMVYTVEQTMEKEIEELSGIIADISGVFNSVAGIVKLIVKIAYIIVLEVTLIKLIKDLIKFIISPVKYHGGMYVRDLMAKGCEYLGLTFESDIFQPGSPYYNEYIIPEKRYNPVSSTDASILGFLSPVPNEQLGYYKGTFGQLLDALKIKYNAKVIVTADNKLIFIRKDKNAQPPVYQLPDIYQPEFSYNTDECNATTLIEFEIDNAETNTLQNYLGTNYQVVCQPAMVNTRALVMLKNYNQVTIPFARAFRKDSLTVPETIVDDFLEVFDVIANIVVDVVNGMTSVVNSIVSLIRRLFRLVGIRLSIPPIPQMQQLSLGVILDNRIGMMVLSADNFDIPKILILQEGSESKYNKIPTDNVTVESAKAMWNNFYYVNSFLPGQLNPAYSDRPTGNQFVKRTFPAVPFTWDDFLNVFTNNQIRDAQGREAIIESLKFNPYKETAEVSFRVKQLYTLNLTETFLEPSGN